MALDVTAKAAAAPAAAVTATDPHWYRDAVVYQLHVKSFFDANDDGVGDFAGLMQKLDYVAGLGVDTLWLLPFYPSPRRDDGYDIADYRGVHPDYGTLADAKRFVKAAHARGLRVITELVINHTSADHPWFQRARRARPGSRERDYYVWSDTDQRWPETRIIFIDTEKSNWTWDPVANAYFWHRFYSHQPDLNFDNPRVLKEVLDVMRFWLDIGVDGLRLDAVPYLVERDGTINENLPETHDVLKRIRAALDARYRGRMLLAEANQWPEDTQQYFGQGDECHMAFHFPLMPRLFMAIQMEDRFPIIDILDPVPATAGFVGKVYLIEALADGGYTWLGVVIVVGSMISLAYYLRVIAVMWMRPGRAPQPVLAGGAVDVLPEGGAGPAGPRAAGAEVGLVAVLAGGATLVFGVYPRPLFDLAERVGQALGLL